MAAIYVVDILFAEINDRHLIFCRFNMLIFTYFSHIIIQSFPPHSPFSYFAHLHFSDLHCFTRCYFPDIKFRRGGRKSWNF